MDHSGFRAAIARPALLGATLGGICLGTAAGALGPLAAGAVELRGATFFTRPPWKADLVSYTTDAGDPRATYFFSVELDAAAGASLGGLLIRQSAGPDRIFPYSLDRTQAFLGRPRGHGAAIPVEAELSEHDRAIRISFPEPVAPGSTVTVSLKPWSNPTMPGTYLFQVTAFPAGPNPNATALGSARLRIYRPDWR
ncbi:MAG: DUF2808 domain-containing protein [Cyanobacteria bacterium J06638_7]